MGFEQKPGTGALFQNNRKEQDSHPDYTGNGLTPDGVAFDLAGWKKKDKNGNTFLSLSIKPPRERQEEQRSAPKPQTDDDFSSIPF